MRVHKMITQFHYKFNCKELLQEIEIIHEVIIKQTYSLHTKSITNSCKSLSL